MPFASALSEHPITAAAVGEVVGSVLESLGEAPDLAVVFVTPPHGGALEDIAATVCSVLQPRVLIGCAGESVVGTAREVEAEAAVSLWAARTDDVVPVELSALGSQVVGFPAELPFEPQALVLLADPFSFPVDAVFDRVQREWPGLPVVGGQASAARGPGGNRLCLGRKVLTSGGVGAFVGPSVEVETVVSQGCRPIGRPLVVTRSEQNVIHELAGRPPLDRLRELAASGLSERELGLLNRGLHLGLVIDEHREQFERGDFLVRGVIGADPESGAIAVGDLVDLGTTVQFHVRDADTADEDLRALLAGGQAEGALLFTCNGRGSRMFSEPDHDATVLAEALDSPPTAGFFAAGEFGPVGGRNFLHGFTASMALFRDRRR